MTDELTWRGGRLAGVSRSVFGTHLCGAHRNTASPHMWAVEPGAHAPGQATQVTAGKLLASPGRRSRVEKARPGVDPRSLQPRVLIRAEADDQRLAAFENRPLDDRRLREHELDGLRFVEILLR